MYLPCFNGIFFRNGYIHWNILGIFSHKNTLKWDYLQNSCQKLGLKPLADGINSWTLGGVLVFFAERPTEWIAVSNPSAGNQRFYKYVYMYM